MNFSYENKVALVTGAGAGMGLATARASSIKALGANGLVIPSALLALPLHVPYVT